MTTSDQIQLFSAISTAASAAISFVALWFLVKQVAGLRIQIKDSQSAHRLSLYNTLTESLNQMNFMLLGNEQAQKINGESPEELLAHVLITYWERVFVLHKHRANQRWSKSKVTFDFPFDPLRTSRVICFVDEADRLHRNHHHQLPNRLAEQGHYPPVA